MKIIDNMRKIFTLSILPMVSLTLSSCSNIYIYKELKDKFEPWYNSLTTSDWNRDSNGKIINYYCSSETQAITLYANNHGNFWNEYLHKQQEPRNVTISFPALSRTPLDVRGEDYKYIDSALEKATFPFDLTAYHVVEYMETEFYEQLHNFISYKNNQYDYSNCVGKTITSYGYISTTLSTYRIPEYFSYRPPWTEHINEWNALKEKTVFCININKGYVGASYLADFYFNGLMNYENQIMIKRNSNYKINKVDKIKGINIFYVDLI